MGEMADYINEENGEQEECCADEFIKPKRRKKKRLSDIEYIDEQAVETQSSEGGLT